MYNINATHTPEAKAAIREYNELAREHTVICLWEGIGSANQRRWSSYMTVARASLVARRYVSF